MSEGGNNEPDQKRRTRKYVKVMNDLDLWAGIPKKFVGFGVIMSVASFVAGGWIGALVFIPIIFFSLFTVHEKDPFALLSFIERRQHSTSFLAGEVEKRRLLLIKSTGEE